MFIFTAHSKAIFASALLVLATAASAADREVDGVVQSVNISDRSLSVRHDGSGKAVTYSFDGTPKVNIGGRKYRDLSVLEVGQNVTLKFKSARPEEKPFSVHKGEVQKIDLERNVALIRPENGDSAQLVPLPRSVAVSGLRNGVGIHNLKEGDLVTLKYSSK